VQHSELLPQISWFAQRMSKRPMDVDKAWSTRSDGDVFDKSKSDGCDALSLDLSRKQSDGPRADRSSWHQEHQINTRALYAVGDLSDRRHETLRTAHEAETVMDIGQSANDTLRL
jgi:hypothetical protein